MRGGPRHGPPLGHPALERRSGNTITVRPRRGGPGAAAAPEPPQPAPGPLPPPKKRYPTAEEIQVIGGYLALPRSCLAKSHPHRKKLKIWFSERELERTFCYPSEGALLAAWGPPRGAAPPPGPPPMTMRGDEPLHVRGGPGGCGHEPCSWMNPAPGNPGLCPTAVGGGMMEPRWDPPHATTTDLRDPPAGQDPP
ncbi:phostensin [Strigops habroptila]|uniref:phostensin n=1 Tax=Strigops habroptila TaxID=2489341 RepID=UPI0011CEE604|nr:phostensin [Strigops habroptila]